jgi:hypothetical protein
MIVNTVRHRLGRAVALVLGVLVATTGFTVLIGDTATARLQVTATVNANARSAYDILVRPAGSRDTYEQADGLVRPNVLSGQYGGVTLDQWRTIASIPGIDVAAPIAMYGYARVAATVQVDLTDHLDPTATTQVLQVDQVWTSDRGLSSFDDPGTRYVYVTRRPVVWADIDQATGQVVWSDGKTRPRVNRCTVPSDMPGWIDGSFSPIEIAPDGSERRLCEHTFSDDASYDPSVHPRMDVYQVLPDGGFRTLGLSREPRLIIHLIMPMYLLLAGVDPESEARLVGLDSATVSGDCLPAGPIPLPSSDDEGLPVPVLATTTPGLDESLSVSASRVVLPPGSDVVGPGWASNPPVLGSELRVAPRVRLGGDTVTADDEYRELLAADLAGDNSLINFFGLLRPLAPEISRAPDGTLVPATAPTPVPALVQGGAWSSARALPVFLTDRAYRRLDLAQGNGFVVIGATEYRPVVDVVGTFDPGRLLGVSPLAGAPLETYQRPELVGADRASRDALGDQPLAPNSNPAGYLSAPPMLLTTLSGPIFGRDAISAVRVRVSGVTGVDPLSRERVRLAAQQIQERTGLDVDITFGSSLTGQTVALEPGAFGRPALRLTEPWTKLGVAVSIIQAVDRKSIVLFGLILVVCVLFLANAVSAAVRDRQRELAVLACLGWPRRRLAALIAGEVAALGLVAGVLSVGLSLPLAWLAGISLQPAQALVAIPLALGLAALATLAPVARAASARPAAAVAPAVLAPRRGLRARHRTVAGVALANLWRTPGRTVLGALALAVGVAATTLLAFITWAFHGAVTGTLLGEAVSLQVRGVDQVAVMATVVLGLVVVADVLYLNIRDRASEFAALRATGWPEPALARLVTYEGLGIGLFGAVIGAGAGLAGAAVFAGGLGPDQIWLAAVAAAGAVLTAGVAAAVPALLQRRLPMSVLLSEEI